MKEEILEYFKDINHAYNDCTRFDTLKRMLGELQEPKTGHWIFDKHYYCSECKSMGVDYWNYCPYCGAKMQEVEG